MRLYLASTSPARLATLRAAGVEPVVLPSGVDEPAVVAALEAQRGPLDEAAMVSALAEAKARAVVGTQVEGAPIDGFIFGGDSAFEFDGHIHGKPHTAEVARARWRDQRGGEGVLWSGHCLIDHRGGHPQGVSVGVDSARVRFEADISDAEIDAYISTGEPLSVAGAFTIDARGAAFVSWMAGAPSAVIGLSIPMLRRMLLRDFEVSWTSLWNGAENPPL
ncbi:Maf family protein [Parafrigoribacterium mesophilum]|uniref:Maf family protein n=1 Tax=Parafrigoribacterium mesophilum TaxID=433646 RepID=UPI0031FD9AD0